MGQKPFPHPSQTSNYSKGRGPGNIPSFLALYRQGEARVFETALMRSYSKYECSIQRIDSPTRPSDRNLALLFNVFESMIASFKPLHEISPTPFSLSSADGIRHSLAQLENQS